MTHAEAEFVDAVAVVGVDARGVVCGAATAPHPLIHARISTKEADRTRFRGYDFAGVISAKLTFGVPACP